MQTYSQSTYLISVQLNDTEDPILFFENDSKNHEKSDDPVQIIESMNDM